MAIFAMRCSHGPLFYWEAVQWRLAQACYQEHQGCSMLSTFVSTSPKRWNLFCLSVRCRCSPPTHTAAGSVTARLGLIDRLFYRFMLAIDLLLLEIHRMIPGKRSCRDESLTRQTQAEETCDLIWPRVFAGCFVA
eukprot:TRINITY_DN31976_c0_g1_i1.p1 TRINITY_DN31976_c0_g1~~TRINITY_DN31976_c0_g1_i1.p1  ORF type:complete len:135 (+),score=8.37 TRINITY_DN31976_c0_g1_i1:49-453(+)